MSSIGFKQVAAFKPGDIFYECEYGMNMEFCVLTAPVPRENGGTYQDGTPYRQLEWLAVNTQTGEMTEFLTTDLLMHYGPRMYTQPEYAAFVDGGWTTRLHGEDYNGDYNYA